MGADYHHMLERQRGDGVDDLAASLRAFINPVKFPLAPQQEFSCGRSAGVDVLGKADSSAEDVGAWVLGGVRPTRSRPLLCTPRTALSCPSGQFYSTPRASHRPPNLRPSAGTGVQASLQHVREEWGDSTSAVQVDMSANPGWGS